MNSEKLHPSITPPDWSIRPANIREIVHEDGRPSFDFVHIPENGLVFPLSQVRFSESVNALVLPPEIELKKETLISKRKEGLKINYDRAVAKWEKNGSIGEKPPQPSFFDGRLVRVVPSETSITTDPDGNRVLTIPVGETSYFDYVATRDIDQSKYSNPEQVMALPLATCGILTAKDTSGNKHLIYTVRTTKPESYQGYFHMVGGMLSPTETELISPSDSWIKELEEEAGIHSNEVEVEGSLGLVMDQYWPHPEITFKAELTKPLEELFMQNETSLNPNRKTDKEVLFRSIPWTPHVVRALILGEKVAGGDQDLRPWVPTGLANLLLAGKSEFGQDWFESTIKEYLPKISLLNLR